MVVIFSFLYRFTRQTFTPLSKVINLDNFHNPDYFFRGDNISSIFALIYALLQIPYGLLMDKYGFNLVIKYLTIFMTLGFWLTAWSPNSMIFAFGRFLTIMGAAGAFIGTVKIMTEDYGPVQSKSIVGKIIATTVLGSLCFVKLVIPMILNNEGSWRYFYGIKGALMTIVTIYFWCFNKNKISDQPTNKKIDLWNGLKIITTNKKMIYLMVLSLFFFMIYYSIAETQYMTNLLEQTVNLSFTNTSSLLLAGYFLGFLTTSMVYKSMGHLKLIGVMALILTIFSTIMLIKPSLIVAIIFLIFIGYSNGFQIVVLDMASKEIDPQYTATVAAFLNVLFVGGAFIPQQILFKIIPKITIGSWVLFYLVI
jgi:MFS family permease